MYVYEWLHDPQRLKTNLMRKINFPYITYICVLWNFHTVRLWFFLSFGIRKVENLIILAARWQGGYVIF